MIGEESALAVIDALQELQIPFMLVGSFAYNLYGAPRLSGDAGFVIALGDRPLDAITRLLGPTFRLDPQMCFETFTGTRSYELERADDLFRIELFLLSDDPHDLERFQRRRTIDVRGRRVDFLTPEDVIITKLRWGRPKDREDSSAVIAVQSEALDWPYITSWCDLHGTRGLLDEIRRSTPPL